MGTLKVSPQRRECLKAKKCVLCGSGGKLYADHISPVIDPKEGFTTWDNYITRLMFGRLQPVCEVCHKAKTKEENKQRRERKRKLNETNKKV